MAKLLSMVDAKERRVELHPRLFVSAVPASRVSLLRYAKGIFCHDQALGVPFLFGA